MAAQGFQRVGLIKDAAEALSGTDEEKRRFLRLAADAWKLYKAVLPDPRVARFAMDAVVLQVLAERIRSLTPKPDISAVMDQVNELLDRSIAGVAITAPVRQDEELDALFDLSRIDFEKLARALRGGRQRSKAQALRIGIGRKLAEMVRCNPTRSGLMEKFQKLIDAYNAGSVSAEELLNQLLDFVRNLDEEERRAVREELTEEELTIFDLLTRPDLTLTRKQEIQVKKIARSLLEKLKREKLILDWRIKEHARAAVRQAIAEELDRLPEVYTKEVYDRKCLLTYQFVYERYPGTLAEGLTTIH